MKNKLMALMLGTAFTLVTMAPAFAQDPPMPKKDEPTKKESKKKKSKKKGDDPTKKDGGR